jgi:hypothetical protein
MIDGLYQPRKNMTTKYSLSIYCENLAALLQVANTLKTIPDMDLKIEAQATVADATGEAPKGKPGRPKKDTTSTAASGAPAATAAAGKAAASSPAQSQASVDPLGDGDDDSGGDPLGLDEDDDAPATATFEEVFEKAKSVSQAKGGNALMEVLKAHGVDTVGKLRKLPGVEDGTLYGKVLAALNAA